MRLGFNIGAFLVGFGTPAFVYGVVEWCSQKPRVFYLVEMVVGLSVTAAGFLLIYASEKRKK
jgi:hypothetical protein